LSLQLKVCCLKPLEKQIWPQMVAWHLNMSKAMLIENSRLLDPRSLGKFR
jgi:hypothetical protein